MRSMPTLQCSMTRMVPTSPFSSQYIYREGEASSISHPVVSCSQCASLIASMRPLFDPVIRRARGKFLRLARSCDGTAGGGPGCGSLCTSPWVDLAIGKSCDVGQLSILQRSCGFATGWAFPIFLVSREVEGDEEQQVGAEDADTSECCEFLSGTFAVVWHPWEVG